MKFVYCLSFLIPLILHCLDGEPSKFFYFLSWYLLTLAPAIIMQSLGFVWSFSRVLAIPLIALPLYLLATYMSFPIGAFWYWGILVLALFILWKKKDSFCFREMAKDETVFLTVFSAFLLINSFYPALYWGEKPMDISLLGYFMRLDFGAIQDPWAAQSSLKYYALGYFSWALPAKASGMNLEQAYVYTIAAVAGLTSMGLISFFSFFNVHKARIAAIGFPFLATLGIVNSFVEHDINQMSFFWSATRVFDYNHFAEFPLWSFLFSDLHPHVMAYPLTALIMSCIALSLNDVPDSKTLVTCSIGLCLLPFVNAWDYLIYSPLCFLILFCYGKKIIRRDVVISFIAIFLCGLLGFLFTKSNSRAGELSFSQGAGFYGLILHFCLGIIGASLCCIKTKNKRLVIFVLSCMALIVIANYVVVMDRVNTVFKFMTSLGFILSTFILAAVIAYKGKIRILSTTLLSLSFGASILLIYCFTLQQPFPVPRPSLKGFSFLKYSLPSDAGIIDYLNKQDGTPLILEVPSKSFDYQAARISAFTGLPTWLGWDQHVVLRGKTWQQVSRRKQWVDGMYESTDAIEVHKQMTKVGVKYVVVGPTERTRYRATGLAKFGSYPELFELVHEHYSSALYRVLSK